MVDRAVADIILVHHVDNPHYHLRVMSGVTVNLNIEYMSSPCQVMIWCLNLSLMPCRTLVVYRHVVGVGIIVAVCHSLYNAKVLAVAFCKPATQSLGRSCQHAIVVMVLLCKAVAPVAHICYNPQSQLLRLLALPMVNAYKCLQTLGKSDEAYAESTLVDDALYGVTSFQLLASKPQLRH